MGNYRDNCVLTWRGSKKTVPFQPTTNMPVFYTAFFSRSYCTFAATFEAMESPYFQREKVLEFPGRRDLMDNIVPEEFVAEDNKLLNKLSQFLLCTKWIDESLFDCRVLHHSKVAAGRRENFFGGSVSPFGNNSSRMVILLNGQ